MHRDDDGRREDGQFRLKARHLILAALVFLLMAGILHMALLSNRSNRRLEALRAAGQPTSLAELAAAGKLAIGVENAAPLYESALAAFVPPADPNTPYVGKTSKSRGRRDALPEAMAQAVADCLAANAKCLALLHEAAGIETCRYDFDYRRIVPDLSQVRSCAQLLTLAVVSDANRGDAEAAIAHIKDELRLGDSLTKAPFLVTYLVRIACTGLAVTGMERALNLTTFTDVQLKDMDDALAGEAGRLDLAQPLIAERCFMIECIRDPSLAGMTGVQGRVLRFPGVRSHGLADILDYMGACIEAAGLPRAQRLPRFREIGARMDKLSMFHLTVKILTPALVRVAEVDVRSCVHLDLARTALAIERYRLAQGEPPEQLADLVPAYLEQVPIDPFDGQPVRYRRTEPGYVLYSIMEDGKDNGGKEKQDVGKGEPFDLCFIVAR